MTVRGRQKDEMTTLRSAVLSKWVGEQVLLVGVAVALLAVGCERMSHAEPRQLASGSSVGGTTTQISGEFNPRLLRRFSPVRPVMASDPSSVTDELVTLGRLLFFDGRLSKNQTLSFS